MIIVLNLDTIVEQAASRIYTVNGLVYKLSAVERQSHKRITLSISETTFCSRTRQMPSLRYGRKHLNEASGFVFVRAESFQGERFFAVVALDGPSLSPII
jgi:hypothetical protein